MPSFSSALPPINNAEELASFLGLSEFELKRFCMRDKSFYASFERPKKSGKGTRSICAPAPELKRVQRRIKSALLDNVELHPGCTGFRPGMSIVDNATIHAGSRFVLNMDIKDFFQSIHTARVAGLFASFGYSEDVSILLSKLCCFRNQVPQGAPSSPAIANLICHKLDRRLSGLAKSKGFKYSRYCDDVTISGDNLIGAAFIEMIKFILQEEGFTVNPDKTRLFTRRSCQIVTGLTVNSKVNIPRRKRRKIRAIFHQAAKNQEPISRKCRNYLGGLASFVNMVRGSRDRL